MKTSIHQGTPAAVRFVVLQPLLCYTLRMTELATFSMGCFWGPDEFFSKVPGVVRTTVGYSGGVKANPTYHDLGDHTETTEIEFDPAIVSYEQLLRHFWDQHDATYKAKTQYKSVIFTHSDAQLAAAEKSKAEEEAKGFHIVTEIKPAMKFYNAEDYHQKYLDKNRGAVC